MLFTSDKEIMTTTPGFEKITILGNSQGLQGFKHKNAVQYYGIWYDSGIWYEPKSDMWECHNIRIFSENLETIQINEQLERYEQKDEIRFSDADFFNLIDKIIERRIEVEVARATSLLLKLGNNKKAKMVNEVNPYKQKSYANVILPFYYKAIEIGSKYFDASALKKQIESIEQFQKSN